MTKIVNLRTLLGKIWTLHIEGQKLRIEEQAKAISADPGSVDGHGLLVLPGLIDAHIHARQPGYDYKEDWQSLARSAFKGGVVGVCDMPNTDPATLDEDSVHVKERWALESGLDFRFFLGVTAENIDRCQKLLDDESLPICGLKVYYGKTTGTLHFDELDRLTKLKTDKVIVFHSEDQCMMDHKLEGTNLPKELTKAQFIAHSEIRSDEAAVKSTQDILNWAANYSGPVHFAHLSTAEEVKLIEQARIKGLRVTGEVAPHHLLFSTVDYAEWGGFLKMNPPVRKPEIVKQLGQAFKEGLIEVFATDHAPHTLAEKQRTDYFKNPSGVPGIEFFAETLFYCAQKYQMSEERAVHAASAAPAKIFGLSGLGNLEDGGLASFCLVRREPYLVEEEHVHAKCGWSPYVGLKSPIQVVSTWHRGREVYRQDASNA
jgi:dihydroorotase